MAPSTIRGSTSRATGAARSTPARAAATPTSTPKSTHQSAAASSRPRRKLPGHAAEQAVARYLVERGYHIVARNLRLQYLELDIVARRGDLVVVVEVRQRGNGAWTSGFGSLDGRKR